MSTFDKYFSIALPLQVIANFHQSPDALKMLTPPLLFVQYHHKEPLAEGSRSEFTMWFGPIPVRWEAVHTQVDRLHGFTDIQVSGPMLTWRHTHRYDEITELTSRVYEHIEYQHHTDWRGWFTRVLFSNLALRLLFAYRFWRMRRILSLKPL